MLIIDSIPTAYNLTLMYAVVWTINSHYASDSSKPLTLIQFSTRESSRAMHNDLIDAVLGLASNAARIKFVLEGERLPNNETETEPLAPTSGVSGRNTGIWLLDSMRAYKRLEQHLLHPSSWFKRNGYYCIIYTGQEQERLATINEIFRRLFAIYVLNVNVLLPQRQNGTVQVYNYYPYRAHRCQSSEPVLYATFQGGLGADPQIHIENRFLFFDRKLMDMHGCKLITVSFEHRPFVIIEDDATIPGGRRMHGIEGMLFRLLAERMNFTIHLIEQPERNRGVALPNGTITGAMRMIVDGLANITIVAYMYSYERSQHMLPSITYTSFPIVLAIPGGRQLSPLARLTKPLGYITWLCILSSVLLGFGLIGTLQMVGMKRLRRFVLGGRNRLPCWSLWSTFFGGLHYHPPVRNFARYLLALWLLETLVLRAAYTGELYILLQDGRVRTPLRTLAEVMDQRHVFHMLPAMQAVFHNMLPMTRVRVVENLDSSLRQLRDDENALIVVPVLQPTVSSFNMYSSPDQHRLTVLPDPLLTAPLTLYMRPHSYLKQRINRLLINMMSSGILHRFRRMYLDRMEQMSKPRKRAPTKLSLGLLAGIFGSFFIMQLLACIVFLLELRSASPQRLRLRRLMNAANRYMA